MKFSQRRKVFIRPEVINYIRDYENKQRPIKVKKGEFNTIMPLYLYAGMTEEDPGAIYKYLLSLDPIENQVVKFDREG